MIKIEIIYLEEGNEVTETLEFTNMQNFITWTKGTKIDFISLVIKKQ